MGNRADQAYGLTILAPVRAGLDAQGMSYTDALRQALAELTNGPGSPFTEVPATHLARLVVYDDLPFEAVPAHEDHLRSAYLLFTSNFDGDLEPYLESMRTRIPETVDRVWRHCIGYPGTSDAASFAAYMRRCQLTTTFFFGAYPQYTTEQVLRALDAQRRLIDFVVAHQGGSDEVLQQDFGRFVQALDRAPTPAPATI